MPPQNFAIPPRLRPLVVKLLVAAAIVIGLVYAQQAVFRAGPYVGLHNRHWSQMRVTEQQQIIATIADDDLKANYPYFGFLTHRTDYTVYTLAGLAVVDGQDIYKVRTGRDLAYVYPPPFAIAMVPLAVLPAFWSALLWYLISLAALVSAVIMSYRWARLRFGDQADPVYVVAVPLVIMVGLSNSALCRGQASVILAWLVVAAFYWHARKKDLWAGSCLAGAIIMKVFPAVFLGYFVWRRQWAMVAVTLVALVLGTLILPSAALGARQWLKDGQNSLKRPASAQLADGWRQNNLYLKGWAETVARPLLADAQTRQASNLEGQLLDPENKRNQSMAAVLTRITRQPAASKGLAMLLGLAMAGAIWWWGRRIAPEGNREWVLVGAGILWALLIPPISESHYFLMALLPLAVTVHLALADPEAQVRRVALWGLGVYALGSWAAVACGPIEWIGSLCAVNLGLWGLLMWVVARPQAPGANGTAPAQERPAAS